MIELYLPIFPEGALAQSVITTVWLGILVVAFFNLRFGWVLSGLVIPGYVIPLFLVKPVTGFVILFEGILTYLLAYLLSEVLSRYRLWSNFFGRDRFFLILILSIVVRLVFDGYLFPGLSSYLSDNYALSFDFHNNLHSFGLIIIALIANYFWKPGLKGGIIPMIVILAVTYLLTRFVLIEFTNFSISNLHFLYEDTASSILASPKSYIILITAAFIASRMNLFYGWEFNGILIPSLLALQWYEPTKILVSFAEAFVILYLAIWILKLPLFRHSNITGARQLIFFFNIGFFYKFLVSMAVISWLPESKVTDFFGFGYLLSTLMALKMYEKSNVAVFSRATLQTSLVSVVVATLIGYTLLLLPEWKLGTLEAGKVYAPLVKSEKPLYEYMRDQKVSLYSYGQQEIRLPNALETDHFNELLYALSKGHIEDERIPYLLQSIGYRSVIVEERYLVLTELEPRGWGSYIVDLESKSDLLIEVPKPLEQWGVVESALILMKQNGAKALCIAGTLPKHQRSQLFVTTAPMSFFHQFHKKFDRNSVLQVRGLNRENRRLLLGVRSMEMEEAYVSSQLNIKQTLPVGINFTTLASNIGGIDFHWNEQFGENVQKMITQKGFAELYLSKNGVRGLLASRALSLQTLSASAGVESIDGLFQRWLLENKIRIAPKFSNSYTVPKLSELLFFDDEIMTPLAGLLTKVWDGGKWSDDELLDLKNIASLCEGFGYRLMLYKDSVSGEEYLILYEPEGEQNRFWGTYVFRTGKATPYSVMVPRPLFEKNTFEYGFALFSNMNAAALLLSNTHPFTNVDRSSDVQLLKNRQNIFNLFNQVLLRESKEQAFASVEVRAFASETQMDDTDIIFATESGLYDFNRSHPLERTLYEQLLENNYRVAFADGSAETAGREAYTAPRSMYLEQSKNKAYMLLWVSDRLRSSYKQMEENSLRVRQMRALGMKHHAMLLDEYLQSKRFAASMHVGAVRTYFSNYLKNRDVNELMELQRRFASLSFEVVTDISSKQSYIIVLEKKSEVVMVIKMNAIVPMRDKIIAVEHVSREDILAFYHSNLSVMRYEP